MATERNDSANARDVDRRVEDDFEASRPGRQDGADVEGSEQGVSETVSSSEVPPHRFVETASDRSEVDIDTDSATREIAEALKRAHADPATRVGPLPDVNAGWSDSPRPEVPSSDGLGSPKAAPTAADMELLRTLEELHETLDVAQSALALSEAADPEPAEVTAAVAEPGPSPGKGRMVATVAGSLALLVGVVGVLWLWLGSKPSKDEARVNETIVQRMTGVQDPSRSSGAPKSANDALERSVSAAVTPSAPIAPPDTSGSAARSSVAPARGRAGQPARPTTVAAATDPAASAPPVSPQPTRRERTSLPALSEEESARFMARGKALMTQGDVAGARLIFEHVAQRGGVDAMVALGQSYDPSYLARLDVQGIEPEIDKAIEWYRRAAQSGDTQSRARAAALQAQIQR